MVGHGDLGGGTLKQRDVWLTRWGVIMAMAGNAIGLGNFLRFPVQAAQNGGGAFMIPYFVCLLVLGIPLMWIEWAMGRYGGSHGHGTTPGMFDLLWKHPLAKYVGALGIILPTIVGIYYLYIESWTLAYSFFSLTGKYFGLTTTEKMGQFLSGFQGTGAGTISFSWPAYAFLVATLLVNLGVLYGGIAKGIERLAVVGMPLLFVFAFVLLARVLTLGAPDPAVPENNVVGGLGFIWNPDFSQLRNAKVWLAAAGQVFFTLSVGFGIMACYASYLRRRDDVVVTGLSTAMTNEFAEVILGGSIAIPIAYAFFGLAATVAIAKGGAFNLGFMAMPVIFQKLVAGRLLGTIWFFLLFIAGITSSVALLQGPVSFLQDELGWSRKKAVTAVGLFVFVAVHIPVLGLAAGALDEMDFWAGTVGLALLGFIETVIFMWVFGPKKAWEELHIGAEIRLPKVFFYILTWVTPVVLLVVFLAWAWQSGWDVLSLKGVKPEHVPWHWAARLLILVTTALVLLMVRGSWKKRGLVKS
ncbi:MAG: sodium-dependent transporter [Verrucomicrobiota bacterium]